MPRTSKAGDVKRLHVFFAAAVQSYRKGGAASVTESPLLALHPNKGRIPRGVPCEIKEI
jgi:hypothetical protein